MTPRVHVMSTTWKVTGTKNGSYPVSVEPRPKGKRATVISNVDNGEALCASLRRALGTGGSVLSSSQIEVQGDHTTAVTAFLSKNHTHLKGIAGLAAEVEAAAKGRITKEQAKDRAIEEMDDRERKREEREANPRRTTCGKKGLPGLPASRMREVRVLDRAVQKGAP